MSEWGYEDELELNDYYVRLCDIDDEWDHIAGNSDALCNEECEDYFCSTCDKKYECEYSNWPYLRTTNLTKIEKLKHRNKLKNTEICKDCIYNEYYEWVPLTLREARKYKITKLSKI